jgi:hypothetical protein
MAEKLTELSMIHLRESDKAIFVDWIRTEFSCAHTILQTIGRPVADQDKLLARLRDYICQRDKRKRGKSEGESWRTWKEDTERTLLATVT